MIALRRMFPMCPLTAGAITNDKVGPWLAWHSPHSLTWSWIARVQFVPPARPSWLWHRNSVGFGCGVPRWIYVSTHTTNGGRQWDAHFLLCAFAWSRQRPMWFRDLYRKERESHEVLRHQSNLMRRFGGVR